MADRRRGLAALLAVLAAAVVVAVLVWQLGGGDAEASAVAGLPGVREAADDGSGGLTVTFEDAARVDQVAAVLGELDSGDDATLRLGAASLDFEDESFVPDREAARLLVAAGGIEAQPGVIDLDQGSEAIAIRATPPEALDASSLARSLVLAISDDGDWPGGVELLTVAGPGVSAGEEPVTISHPVDGTGKLAALLAALSDLRRRAPRLVITTGNTELRVRAADPEGAGEAWDELASAVLPIGFDDADTYVDVPDEGGDGTRPLISGPLHDDPEAALALTDRLGQISDRAFATTDLAYVEADLAGPTLIGPAAEAVASSGPPANSRLKLEWRGGVESDGGGEVEDSPAGVARLGPGIARAAREGLGVAWQRLPGEAGPALLGFRGPSRFRGPAIGSLIGHPDKLRGLARAIRAVDWPGTASFQISLGNGTCDDLPTVAAVVAVVSTSDGPALTVRESNDCSSPVAVAAVRRAWEATASAG